MTISKNMTNKTKRRLFQGLSALFLTTGLMTTALSAQTITSVQNPASNILVGLPNYGIAQGSIFVLYGSNLGPTTISQAPVLPFGTTLSGTSIKITAGGSTYNAFMIYTLNSQVAAVMPSNVPVGPATVQVTYNNNPGAAFPTTIVATNFGISTVNQTGTGPAVVTYINSSNGYSVITNQDSTKPGSIYTMWGTGLGAANSDSNIATNGDLGTPITVWVGGQKANVTYRGRSGSPGLDQVNFAIPAGLSGCNISVVVQTSNLVSNTTTIPVAPNGGACSDPVSPSNAAINAALAKGSVSIAAVGLSQSNISLGTILGTPINQSTNAGSASFYRYTPAQYAFVNPASVASYGSCTVSITTSTSGTPTTALNFTGLDAGSVITVTPPSGSASNLTTTALAKGFYSGTLSGLPAGTYKISGTGGADVGAFSVSLPVASPLVWTNQTSLSLNPIVRSQSATITWTGGDPGSYATILGVSAQTSGGTTTSVQFFCTAPVSAGQFTIPSSVLLALPASSVTQGISNGYLYVGSTTAPVAFTAPGVDTGYAIAASSNATLVNYQ
jgi:uncharacterized protein (TIGR03437 family)